MPQINAVGGGRGIHPLRHLADNLDPFDDIAPSTVAMIILFGSIIFATAGMAARDWLGGDKRAISAAMKAHTMPSTNYSSKKDHAGDSRSRTDTKQIIQPWEPTFVSTFILFSQIGCFGIILFVIYSFEKSSAARPMPMMSGFDQDEFVFWILVVLLYTSFLSWKRNDGKPDHFSNKISSRAHVQDDATQTSRTTTSRTKMNEKIRQRTIEMASLRQTIETGNRDDGVSSQGSDPSKRLEEVLLTDNTVFDSILDTIDDDIQSKDESELGLLEKGSRFLGFNSPNGESRRMLDAKQENDVLNRSQTLEWKGFLSAIMLVYQYNMGEFYQPFSNENKSSLNSNHVYANLAKAAMTSLLFLTGYNHTYYYFHHPSNINSVFQLSRVLQVCMRLNLLAIFMCFVLGKANYGVCLIHTCCFLLIWIMMHIGFSMNYDKYLFRLKLLGAAVGIFLFWDCNFSRVVKIHDFWEASQTLWEFYCASYLHHWSAFIGVIFAINQPIASLQLRKLESLSLLNNMFAKTLLSGTLSALALAWAVGPLRESATVYNVSHPYFGIIPTLLLVNLRNVNCWLREHHIGMLSWLGKYSLEIYILHHHASNILLVRGYPRCNFLAISMILIFTARLLHNITLVIRHMLFPTNDEEKCYQNTVMCSVAVMILYVVACILTWAETISLGTISTVTMIVGILLYQALMEMTWSDYSGTSPKLKKNHFEDDDEAEEGGTPKVSPTLLATLSIFLMGFALYQNVLTSSSQSCNPNHANKGRWVPLNACLARTKLGRDFNAMNYFGPTQCSTLNTTEQWAWPENKCGFHYHSRTEVQLKLQEKRIVFIGDSSVRKLYQSLCRFTGDLSAGGYEGTSTSHSDASTLIGSTSLEFKWAPLSVDITTKIKGMKASLSTEREGGPDIIIAGGGVWDKLHLSVTDEDQSSQEETIKILASELMSTKKMSGASVVWFIPPIINTVALNSDEKRAQISEGNVDEMRRMYAELGVPQSASFVLDGPQFTQDRVSDSFDGVHYPSPVYDAGSQIVLNALDQLWGGEDTNAAITTRTYLPATSSLINPYLGLMMLCFVVIGLFYFDVSCFIGET